MSRYTLPVFALVLATAPGIASACMPASPYDYPIRGAYLGVFLSFGVALALELFRFLVKGETARRRLRFGSFAFLLLMLASLVASSVFRSLESDWRESLPTLPAGADMKRC